LTSNCPFPGDLQEPFRWLADVTVMDSLESGMLDLPDFYFTGDDYRYRFEPEAKQRFLELLRERFNSGVRYEGRRLKWDTVIERKTLELGRFLVGRSKRLDFSNPCPRLARTDDREFRTRILNLTQQEVGGLEWESTRHYLRRRARKRQSTKTYRHILKSIGSMNQVDRHI